MQGRDPIKLDERIYLIDGFDLGVPGRTGTYVIDEEELTLIETGPSPSVKYIKEGLSKLNRPLEEVKYIIVTHVHLDHAGGAGLLLEDCPNASIVVHPRGEKHLVDPQKLAGGARAIYGNSFSELFDPIKPVPQDRVVVKEEGDILQINYDCLLQFWDTPGHAKHHFSIYDPVSNGMFTGDTTGVRYESLIRDGVDLYLPSTSPNHFNPNDMKASIERIKGKNLDRIYFGHFNMTEDVDNALNQVSEWLDVYMEIAEEAIAKGKRYDELSQLLMDRVKGYLREQGIDDDHEAYVMINLDMQLGALGIVDYYQKIKQ